MSEFDSPWKEALDSYFEPFLAFFFPQAHRDIDWARGYEMLDKELQQIAPEAEQGRRVVDKLVKVWRRGGREEWVLAHVEVQSQEETEFARRMYVYNYRIFDRYNRRVASLAVLGDERPGWRPDQFGYDLWGCAVSFRYPVAKLTEYAAAVAALEADPNPFAAVVLAHLMAQETRPDPQARLSWKVRLVKGLYERGLSAEDVRRLFRFIDWMLDLPRGLADTFEHELTRFEQEKRMPYITSVERHAMEKGLLKGIEECLEIKFGAAGLQLLPDIRQIEDMEVLQQVLQAIKTSNQPDELRRIWQRH